MSNDLSKLRKAFVLAAAVTGSCVTSGIILLAALSTTAGVTAIAAGAVIGCAAGYVGS